MIICKLDNVTINEGVGKLWSSQTYRMYGVNISCGLSAVFIVSEINLGEEC